MRRILVVAGAFEDSISRKPAAFSRNLAKALLDDYSSYGGISIVCGGTPDDLFDIADGGVSLSGGDPGAVFWLPEISGNSRHTRSMLEMLPEKLKRTYPETKLVCAFGTDGSDVEGRNAQLKLLTDRLGADYSIEVRAAKQSYGYILHKGYKAILTARDAAGKLEHEGLADTDEYRDLLFDFAHKVMREIDP